MSTRDEDIWTRDWPIEPGWYWTWDPAEDGGARKEPAQAIRQNDGSLRFGLDGVCIYERDYPDMLWGPKIDVPPDPPWFKDPRRNPLLAPHIVDRLAKTRER